MTSNHDPRRLNFVDDGAELFAGAALSFSADLQLALAGLSPDQAGVRLHGVEALRLPLSAEGAIGSIATAALGRKAMAVRAILFDKTAEMNWSLAWHQDRTICVKQRREVPGFGPWTTKAGMLHVSPPYDVLAQMATLRVHLDDVPASNAPLLVAPGSHRLGRIAADRIEAAVQACGVRACLAKAGDVWLYATPILHASEAAAEPKRRRVLQVDFAALDLPGGLEWQGL